MEATQEIGPNKPTGLRKILWSGWGYATAVHCRHGSSEALDREDSRRGGDTGTLQGRQGESLFQAGVEQPIRANLCPRDQSLILQGRQSKASPITQSGVVLDAGAKIRQIQWEVAEEFVSDRNRPSSDRNPISAYLYSTGSRAMQR